jgi:hypothetical protein
MHARTHIHTHTHTLTLTLTHTHKYRLLFYYESIKRELKIKPIYEC